MIALFPIVLATAMANPPALVSFDELARRLADPAAAASLRIVDVRPRADYDQGHLPEAVWADAKAATALAARPGGLADADAWSAWLAPLAIGPGPEVEVLVVDGARQLEAARVWWLLGYLGVPRVGLVDGNMPLWSSQGRPLTAEPTRIAPRAFPVTLRPDRLATRPEVLTALGDKSTRVIDARTEAEHTGEKALSRRGGHIPAACRVEWTDLVAPAGRFLPPSELQAKFAAAGLRPGEPAISHCQGGGRASVDAFVLERLGHPTRNYYLGWSDWGNADETPVIQGKE